MQWNNIDGMSCSVARTLSVIGERWTLLIIRDCFYGIERFDEFQKRLGVTRHLLTDRLNKLTEEGILERHLYQTRPERYAYRLTGKGKDVYPILITMVSWGDKWMSGEAGAPMEYVHESCGRPMQAMPASSKTAEAKGPPAKVGKTRQCSRCGLAAGREAGAECRSS